MVGMQRAITCFQCTHTAYCVAGAQAGPLFLCASCTPLLHQPFPIFPIFPLGLSVQTLPSVSSGMPALPCPSPLCSTSSPLPLWPGCPAGAACSPPGQLACLMAPFIRPEDEGLRPTVEGKGECGEGACCGPCC